MTVLSHIFYLWRFETVKLHRIDHNASRYAQIQDGVAIVEKLNCRFFTQLHGLAILFIFAGGGGRSR